MTTLADARSPLTSSHHSLTVIGRHRLEVRTVLLALALVVVTTGASIWTLERLIEDQLDRMLERNTVEVGRRLTDKFRPNMVIMDEETLVSVLDRIIRDEQLAFLVVEDANGRRVVWRVGHEPLWERFGERESDLQFRRGLAAGRPAALGWSGAAEARALRMPVFANAEAGIGGFDEASRMPPSTVGDPGRLLGHILIGVVDPAHRAAVQRLRALSFSVVCIACLVSIPVTILAVRRLTRPLRRIVDAITILASGGELPPLPIKRRDEIGLLARSFAETAQRLSTARSLLIQANASLEQQVAVRTAELLRLNDRLRLEIETKNEFLRTVSHDLNAPLRNIAGMTEMIQRRFAADLPEEVSARLERIAANVRLETAMLDDLLELSRLRTRPGECEAVNLGDLIHRIVEALDHELAQRGIECEIADDLPTVYVEANLARQVFLNLIDNAIKYMGDRPVRRIRVTPRIGEDMVHIAVSDTGPGIPDSERDQIFAVFRRGSRSTKVPGRGIGLPSVRAVVERWGGTISLESEPGSGSSFVVSIPVDRVIGADCAGRDISPTTTNDSRRAA